MIIILNGTFDDMIHVSKLDDFQEYKSISVQFGGRGSIKDKKEKFMIALAKLLDLEEAGWSKEIMQLVRRNEEEVELEALEDEKAFLKGEDEDFDEITEWEELDDDDEGCWEDL